MAGSLNFNYNDNISIVYIYILQLENNLCSGCCVVYKKVSCVETCEVIGAMNSSATRGLKPIALQANIRIS
jgi:hypothetical protein